MTFISDDLLYIHVYIKPRKQSTMHFSKPEMKRFVTTSKTQKNLVVVCDSTG